MRPGVEPVGERVALRPGVYCARHPDGGLYLSDGRAVEALGRLDFATHATLRLLAGPAIAGGGDDPNGGQHRPAEAARALLRRLRRGGWLSVTVTHDSEPQYTLVPRRRPPHRPPDAEPPEDLVLSKFSLLRRVGNRLVLESPLAWCTVEIYDPALLAELGEQYALGGARGAAARPGIRNRLRRDLWWAGMLEPRPGDGDPGLRLRQWSPHELWFHDRTWATPGPGGGSGGTWWARGTFPPLPAVRDPFDGPVVPLHRPDLAALRSTDPPLTAVLEDRRTVREHDDDAPLTVDRLGEFLYRCCRNRRRWLDHGVTYVSRPYPAGGSCHELEIYPAVRHVAGIGAGLYYYDPHRHHLTLVDGPGRELNRLVAAAVRAATLPRPPQVVLVLAARFGRVMWKYQAMGYALILMHVGVLYQVMYSVATAMGLAPCGLGGSDPDAFRHATGLDPAQEDTVGGFLLGSRPAGPAAPEGSA